MPYAAVVLLTLLALAAPAGAQTAGQQPMEIPGSPLALGIEAFEGAPVSADPHRPLRVPQHPFMAPDPGSRARQRVFPLSQSIAVRYQASAMSTDQSLVGAGRSLVVENNFGYSAARDLALTTTLPRFP